MRTVSGTEIDDAPSGFRAISREAALRINVFSEYTYTLETIIQAGQKKMAITSVPVSVNGHLRPSRLVKSIPSYVFRSVLTIFGLSSSTIPFGFSWPWAADFSGGFLVGVRFLFFYFTGNGEGHVQSLVLASILLGMGFQSLLFAFIVDLLAVNRKLLEENQYKLRKIECPRAVREARMNQPSARGFRGTFDYRQTTG